VPFLPKRNAVSLQEKWHFSLLKVPLCCTKSAVFTT
jgi:hypothetical protein